MKFHPFDWLVEICLQTEGQGAHHKIVSLQPMSGFSPCVARGEILADIYFCQAEISSKICKTWVEHVTHVEKSYWKTNRTIDTKLNKLQIALEVEDKEENSKYSDSTEEEKDE